MRIRTESSLAKTLSFAVIHLAIAVSLGWLFTGGFVLGGVLALVEPAANTVVSHFLETGSRRWGGDPRRRAFLKSGLLTGSHFVVAMAVGYLLSGSWVVAGAYALIEPLANGVAHFFFDRWWEGRAAAEPVPAAA